MTPKILYKYRTDSPLTENIIKDKKVWLSNPKNLNDPFECQTGMISSDWEREVIRNIQKYQLAGFVSSFKNETLFSMDKKATKFWIKRFSKLDFSRKVKAMRTLYDPYRQHRTVN